MLCKTKNEVITMLYSNPQIENHLSKAAYEKDRDELKANVFLMLCEKPEEEILRMFQEKKLINFVITCIYNESKLRNSRLNRQVNYIPNRVENGIELRTSEGYLMDFLKDEHATAESGIDLKNAFSYLDKKEKQIVQLFLDYGSIKEVCDHSGHANKYVSKVLATARGKIKNHLG